jgi:hypothetical protein
MGAVVAETPLWVPLVVAALGLAGTILGTIGGVPVAQRRSDRRDTTNWERERERERERWAREDTARTFDHRRDAYSDFYESLREMALTVYEHGLGLRHETELGEWQLPTYRKLQHLRLYATNLVGEAATNAYNAAWEWGYRTKFGQANDKFHDREAEYDAAQAQLLEAMRLDLSIPND